MNLRTLGEAVAASLLATIVAVGICSADGIIIPEPPPDVPIEEISDLAIKYHRVQVEIRDQVATTRIDQVFLNDMPYDLEGTYIFPLPEEAAISEFAMYVDGERLEGQILDRDQARRIYEDIVRRRVDPALLEYVGRDAFQARVYPIPANGEKRIQLEYSQILEMDGGLVHYVYPLDTERFSSRPLEEVAVTVDLRSRDAIRAIYSPSHDIEVERIDDHHARISFEDVNVLPDRDFELYYSVSDRDVGLNVISYRAEGEDGFFLLLAAPPAEDEAAEVVEKDVILVLDTSGSMKGEKIAQAKKALNFVLDHLNQGDRFNVVAFSSATRQFASGLKPASEREQARRFVEGLEAVGGTDINRALLEALSMERGDRAAILIFLTDGLATNGVVETQAIIDNVAQAATEDVRIFTFGIGDDVNAILLDTVAQEHRGVSAYVRSHQSIDEVVSGFYAKISTPLLVDLELDFDRIRVEDTYPYPLPDLFAGSQLVMVGRYADGGYTTVTLRGSINDETRRLIYEDVHFVDRGGEDFIPRLWATRKIGYLLSKIRLHGEEPELVDEIVDLSVRYGIMTPYTSFLVEEDEDIFTQAGRDEAGEKMFESFAAPAEETGSAAVEESVAREALRAADTVQENAAEIKHIGDKTFILRGGVWTDSTYDSSMETVKVGFGSDDYFRILEARPEWGRYFSVGRLLVVVLEGRVYQVAEGDFPSADVPAASSPTPAAISAADPGQDVVSLEPESRFPVWDRIWNWLRSLARSFVEAA